MQTAQEIMARTLYGEARGEYTRADGGLAALIAVGNVIMNRLRQGGWFGGTVEEVCFKPYQFSCWNKDDPNYETVRTALLDEPILAVCHEVAGHLLRAQWPDITGGCNHYYSRILRDPPYWARGRVPQRFIGQHLFFKLEGA
jgi:spore germination cell wall hydrolase CwlJ-like protein